MKTSEEERRQCFINDLQRMAAHASWKTCPNATLRGEGGMRRERGVSGGHMPWGEWVYVRTAAGQAAHWQV